MKTLVVANQKGGVGKSTLSSHLAFYTADRGQRVLALDLDAQGNLSDTLAGWPSSHSAAALFRREQLAFPANSPCLVLRGDASLADVDRRESAAAGVFVEHLRAANACFDLCVIDTAPAAGLRQIAALAAADFVVSPIELETYSIHGITAMLQTVFGVRQRYNPTLRFLGMLPNRFNSHAPLQKAALTELLRLHPNLVLPFALGLRSAFAESSTLRVPVWRINKTAARDAAREMRSALEGIFKRMEGVTP